MTSLTKPLYLLLTTQFLVTFSLMVLIPVLPLYLEQLGQQQTVSGFYSAMALSAPAVGGLLSAPVVGMLGDRYRYKHIFVAALVLFVLSLLGMAWFESITLFIGARFLLGISGIGVVLTLFFSRANIAPQGQQLGMQQQAISLACLLGPLVGGYSLQTIGMNTVLTVTAGVTVSCLLALMWLLDKDVLQPQGSELGQLATDKSKLSSQIWGWLVAGALSQAGAFALVVGFALYMTQKWPSPNVASQIGVIHALAWCGTFALAGFWGRRNSRGLGAQSFAFGALGCGLSVMLIDFVSSLWFIAILRIIQGGFFATQSQSLFLQISILSPDDQQGQALGYAKSAQVSGQLLGPFAAAFCFAHFGASSVLWLTAGLFIAAAILVSFLLSVQQVNFKVKTQ
ncbi:MFS transporter [Pseudoalteromonas sp. T1lg23B]|uniref:MFS transporter n=1 Tax=Pseudoalteromonas sp. T1lg23B TaxID=2077097 RepID=UPI000CF74104|nr:MFS transporter [Pseudoalteromonas sp. T1lg23B]